MVPKKKTIITDTGAREVTDHGSYVIEDAFDLASQLQQGPGGQAMVIVQAFPVCLLPSLDTLDVTGCPRVMVSTLSKADQNVVSNAIEMGRQIAGGIKTAQSGIVLASAGALPSGNGARVRR